VDLTRSQLYGSGKNTTKVIPVNGNDSSITIDTQRTILVIIDMQSESTYTRFIRALFKLAMLGTDFFLHPAVEPSSVGRDVVPATINMINAFRKNGMKIAWTDVSLYQYHMA
jgi:nicotinamidase-related amidase